MAFNWRALSTSSKPCRISANACAGRKKPNAAIRWPCASRRGPEARRSDPHLEIGRRRAFRMPNDGDAELGPVLQGQFALAGAEGVGRDLRSRREGAAQTQ